MSRRERGLQIDAASTRTQYVKNTEQRCNPEARLLDIIDVLRRHIGDFVVKVGRLVDYVERIRLAHGRPSAQERGISARLWRRLRLRRRANARRRRCRAVDKRRVQFFA